MTKKELADKVAKSLQGTIATSITAEQTEEVINHVLGVIKDSVYCGNEVTLRGFGTFGHKSRKKKTARNISTGEILIVPARRVVSFKPSKDFNVAQD